MNSDSIQESKPMTDKEMLYFVYKALLVLQGYPEEEAQAYIDSMPEVDE